MTEMNRVLKRDKYAVVVIGDCVIKGDVIKADDFMKDISQKTGFEIVRKISYNQKDNTKLFNPKFTNGDKLEHILFLRNVKK